ncbi:dihydrolipoyllysine-residue acetyltransferase [Ferrimonas kyonanensis]|uniref:dihydrolipoyllysine-residue acetyltransferase n=1 Tax=Ferrimonas kyonanensis TaxID=364763 RepID=UPI0003FAE2F1|nr:dihydrolipoyllysine-residue acetyltransferase [Ferrimonas kyonanensis]
MIKDFILPDIGEGVVECEVMDWLVAEGDEIKEDQVVAEVMTDKALVEIPAPFDGKVVKLFYNKGQVAKVHSPLFSVELAEAEVASEPSVAAAPVQSKVVSPDEAEAVTDNGAQTIEDFILPDIGEGIVECEVAEWLVSEGDAVVEDQPICDVMTDKALVQIPAVANGVIHKLYYQKGEIAKVHQPLFALKTTATTANAGSDAMVASSAPEPESSPGSVTATASSEPVARSGKAVASPAVRRLARSLNVDIAEVPGSGKNGRVYKQDIQSFVDGERSEPALSPAPVVADKRAEDSVVPIRGIQAAMARQMTASVQTIPHFTYCEELDLTELVALRTKLKQRYADKGVKLTLMPFIIKAMSVAAKEFPVLNAQVNDDCSEITYKGDHNIGMAVDGKLGLMVPNIKQVQNKSIIEVANEVTRLSAAAREGRVAAEDLKGGTLSVSNIGALGGTVATPIINKPEVAIVALGKLQTLPRFNEQGQVEARTLMQVSWSGDHRVIDGGTIARFCNLWKSLLENPAEMMLHLS